MEHDKKPVSKTSLFIAEHGGEDGEQAGFAAGTRPAGKRRCATLWQHHAVGGSEGAGHRTGRTGGNAEREPAIRVAGQRRAGLRKGLPAVGTTLSGESRGANRV